MTLLSDVELLRIARAGDDSGFDELFRRHYQAACDYAAGVAGPDHAQDRVAEAFARIYRLVRDGRGPETNFRAYLLTAVRHAHFDALRRARGEVPVADVTTMSDLLAVDGDLAERVVDRIDATPMKRVFARLRPSWQRVLWHTVVLGESNESVARQLGLSANALGVLAFRAREGLRQAYLADHLENAVDRDCRDVSAKLPRYVRGQLTAAGRLSVAAHLETCARCRGALAELTRINENLAAVLTPAVVLSVAGGTSLGAPAAKAGLGVKAKLLAATAAGGSALALTVGAVVAFDPGDDVAGPPRVAPSPTMVAPSAVPAPRERARPRRPTSHAPPALSPVPAAPVPHRRAASPRPPAVREPARLMLAEPRVAVGGTDQVRVADVSTVIGPGGARLLSVQATNVAAMSVEGVACEPVSHEGTTARTRCRLPSSTEGSTIRVHLGFADPSGPVHGSFAVTGAGPGARASFTASA